MAWDPPRQDLSGVRSYLSGIAAYREHLSVGESALTGSGAARRTHSAALVALCFFALAALQRADANQNAPVAQAAPAAAQQPLANPGLPGITIEANRERQAVQRRVDKFVASVIVRPSDETLLRWDTPICPLVAGLPKPMGEFILQHISRAALAARAPLDGTKCRPNLYVVASLVPEQLLEQWWRREPRMYDTRHGIGPVLSFIRSNRPIRAWYNSQLGCGSGAPVVPGASALATAGVVTVGGGSSNFSAGAPVCTDAIDTHLSYADVRSLSSALVVIDLHRLHKMTIQQLADYVALLGLADVRLDADPGSAPSILQLFTDHAPTPPGLTPWDQALLYSLYNTRQEDKQQVQDIESTMVSGIAPRDDE